MPQIENTQHNIIHLKKKKRKKIYGNEFFPGNWYTTPFRNDPQNRLKCIGMISIELIDRNGNGQDSVGLWPKHTSSMADKNFLFLPIQFDVFILYTISFYILFRDDTQRCFTFRKCIYFFSMWFVCHVSQFCFIF